MLQILNRSQTERVMMLGRDDWTEVTGRYRVGYGRTDKQSLKSCRERASERFTLAR